MFDVLEKVVLRILFKCVKNMIVVVV